MPDRGQFPHPFTTKKWTTLRIGHNEEENILGSLADLKPGETLTIHTHSNSSQIVLNGERMDAKRFVEYLNEQGCKPGKIEIIGCSAANEAKGESFASTVAKLIGKEVTSFEKDMYVHFTKGYKGFIYAESVPVGWLSPKDWVAWWQGHRTRPA
jgi:hypothetical protein